MMQGPHFWSRFDRSGDGCWEWGGYLNGNGYGEFNHGRRGHTRLAHRLVFEALVGPVPDGMDLDHLCRNRRCVNPAHLEPVTRQENLLRGETIPARHAALMRCRHGHPFDQDNTYWRPDGKGRDCRACRRHADARRSRSTKPVSGRE